jgi:hypothetical protein
MLAQKEYVNMPIVATKPNIGTVHNGIEMIKNINQSIHLVCMHPT